VHVDVRDTDGWGAQAYAGQLALARKDGGGGGRQGLALDAALERVEALGAYRKVELRSRQAKVGE
jgi:hypothetical protein